MYTCIVHVQVWHSDFSLILTKFKILTSYGVYNAWSKFHLNLIAKAICQNFLNCTLEL